MKLHCDLQFDYDNVDLSPLRLPKVAEGVGIIEDDEPETPQVDEMGLMQIMSMGYSQNRATRALMNSGNNLDNALNWIFSNMDDPTLDDPIVATKK